MYLLCFGHKTQNVLLITDYFITKSVVLCVVLGYFSANTQLPPPLPWNEVYFPIFGLGHVTCFGHWEISRCDTSSSSKYAWVVDSWSCVPVIFWDKSKPWVASAPGAQNEKCGADLNLCQSLTNPQLEAELPSAAKPMSAQLKLTTSSRISAYYCKPLSVEYFAIIVVKIVL